MEEWLEIVLFSADAARQHRLDGDPLLWPELCLFIIFLLLFSFFSLSNCRRQYRCYLLLLVKLSWKHIALSYVVSIAARLTFSPIDP